MKQLEIDFEKLRGAIWGRRSDVASYLGIQPESLSRKLHAERRLTIEELNKIAEALGRDATEFVRVINTGLPCKLVNSEPLDEMSHFGF